MEQVQLDSEVVHGMGVFSNAGDTIELDTSVKKYVKNDDHDHVISVDQSPQNKKVTVVSTLHLET